jgi:hypothetical protein
MAGYSQNSDNESGYEAWRKRKAREYARWEQIRQETEGLPSSQRTDRVSGWIDEGFNGNGSCNVNIPSQPSGQSSGGGSHIATSSGVANMRIWAVVVGVADYQSQNSKLNYTDDDAYRMYAFYKLGGKNETRKKEQVEKQRKQAEKQVITTTIKSE